MSAVNWFVSTLLLAAFWLLLVNELSVAQAVLGLALGGAVALVTVMFRPQPLRVRRPAVAVHLLALFLYDIIVANLAVARAALSPRMPIRPQFVYVPLDVHQPGAAALLAAMVTLTPGTVSVDLDLDRRLLRVHGLLVDDEVQAVASIKARYEARIKEIFQC
jgi:multicomponent K+:H+ antiporter subunit E